MSSAQKGILIQAIINYLSEQNTKKNKELVSRNLYTEQTPFDAADMFFKLAFMSDKDVGEIAGKILA